MLTKKKLQLKFCVKKFNNVELDKENEFVTFQYIIIAVNKDTSLNLLNENALNDDLNDTIFNS